MLQFKSMHFLTGEELSQAELLTLIGQAEKLRQSRGSTNSNNSKMKPLRGKTMALMFEKPSLRTRVSFSVGVQELGGSVIELVGSQVKTEEPEDSIRVLQGMVHGLMLRTFEHSTLDRMAMVAKIPIINGLSNEHHPCQAIADLLTMYQAFGNLKGLKLSYVGDGNNVLHSLLLLAPYAGVDVHYACPKGYQPDPKIVVRARERAMLVGTQIHRFTAPSEAVVGTHAVYTDVWTSMGFEGQSQERLEAFKNYQLNLELFSKAAPNAIAMHCLPMNRGLEITSEVIEHPRSTLFQQAENRLHAQKALMVGLFAGLAQKSERELTFSHVV